MERRRLPQRFQPPKQNQNQVQLPKFNGTGNLRSYLNQLDNAAMLGHWTPEYKAGQCYAQLTEGALAFINSRPSADRQTFDRLSEVLQEKYEGKVSGSELGKVCAAVSSTKARPWMTWPPELRSWPGRLMESQTAKRKRLLRP